MGHLQYRLWRQLFIYVKASVCNGAFNKMPQGHWHSTSRWDSEKHTTLSSVCNSVSSFPLSHRWICRNIGNVISLLFRISPKSASKRTTKHLNRQSWAIYNTHFKYINYLLYVMILSGGPRKLYRFHFIWIPIHCHSHRKTFKKNTEIDFWVSFY